MLASASMEWAMPTPYNGIAEAERIGAVHAFLISEGNARMTGEVIIIAGGFDASPAVTTSGSDK